MSTMIQKNEVRQHRGCDGDKMMSGCNGDLMEEKNNAAANRILPLQQRRPNHDDDQVVKLFESSTSTASTSTSSKSITQIPSLKKGGNDPHNSSSSNNNKIQGPRQRLRRRRYRQLVAVQREVGPDLGVPFRKGNRRAQLRCRRERHPGTTLHRPARKGITNVSYRRDRHRDLSDGTDEFIPTAGQLQAAQNVEIRDSGAHLRFKGEAHLPG